MRIVLITPIYATTTKGAGATPVVHYFTREWVKMGHTVKVYHLVPRFPKLFYLFAKLFQHQLNTRLGMLVPTEFPKDCDYVADGVNVCSRGLKKLKPHSRYSRKQLDNAIRLIESDCKADGVPDIFVGHWDNPQLDILCALKEKFHKPVCLVLHNNKFHLEDIYGNQTRELLSQMDIVGFRNRAAQDDFNAKYGNPNYSFIAYSGVAQEFLDAGEPIHKAFEQPAHQFVFVGSLIARKFPRLIIQALNKAYPGGNYRMTYIGDGAERDLIEKDLVQMPIRGEVLFTGRIPREQIINHLRDADVFVMISKAEIFGLVYLEAMAMGVIPVGAKNEGIDGIVQDGVNGFLCKAGDMDELSAVLARIREMDSGGLSTMSQNAKETAHQYSDANVAMEYIKALQQVL